MPRLSSSKARFDKKCKMNYNLTSFNIGYNYNCVKITIVLRLQLCYNYNCVTITIVLQLQYYKLEHSVVIIIYVCNSVCLGLSLSQVVGLNDDYKVVPTVA